MDDRKERSPKRQIGRPAQRLGSHGFHPPEPATAGGVDGSLLFAQGLELFAKGEIDRAIEVWRMAVAAAPSHHVAWCHPAPAREERGDRPPAIPCYRNALRWGASPPEG